MSEHQPLSLGLIQALGLTPRTVRWSSLREALGLHLPPEKIAAIMENYSDGLPAPRLPQWQEGEVTSRYSLPFLEMAPEDQEHCSTLRDGLRNETIPPEWMEDLMMMLQQYPHVPVLYNLEVMYYRNIGDLEKWRQKSEALLQRYPGYIFATCTLASYYLSLQQPDKVPPLFHHEIELCDFDPDEDRVFESSEVSSFYGVMAWYHLYELRLLRTALCISLVHAARPTDPFLDKLMTWLLQFPDHVLLELRNILKGNARA